METLHPAAVDFIEQISLLAESAGFPRIGGRIVGLLIVQEEPLSFDELVSRLQISRGSASNNIRLLEARGVLRRSCRLGERKNLFALDSTFPERMIERRLDEQRAILRAARQARRRLPDRYPRSKDALRRIEDLTASCVQATENVLETWHRVEKTTSRTALERGRLKR